jgi:hypothetical protein
MEVRGGGVVYLFNFSLKKFFRGVEIICTNPVKKDSNQKEFPKSVEK